MEAVPPGEDAAIETIASVCVEMLAEDRTPVLRQQHPWHHACVRAELTIDTDLPPHLRHGVFQPARRFGAVVRLSTGSMRDERRKDVHGCALKLIGVDAAGRDTQDFIFLDSPVFFIRNAIDYAAFATAMLRGFRLSRRIRPRALGRSLQRVCMFGALYLDFFRTHPYEAKLIKAVRRAPGDPLQRSYWSATPYRLGPHAVRYQLRPTNPPHELAAVRNHPDGLREALASHLATRDAEFDLLVQVQTDPVSMPVEDPTIPWDELVAVPRKVGTLRIPPQQFDTPHKRALSETLSFSPANGLPEHRPLGGINRSRAVVYRQLAERRHRLNGVTPVEPDARWLEDVWEQSSAVTPVTGDRTPVGVA